LYLEAHASRALAPYHESMLELAVSIIITASSTLLFGFWCWNAFRLLFGHGSTKQHAEEPTPEATAAR
jgi:hypothetical protein